MTLSHILIFSAAALLGGFLLRERWRGWGLLTGSVIAIYWLQPGTPIRHLDFWLPTATLALTVAFWAITRPREPLNRRDTLTTAGVLTGLVLLIGLTRYLGPVCCLTPTRPPQLLQVLLALGAAAGISALAGRFASRAGLGIAVFFTLILGLFLILKTEPWAQAASAFASPARCRVIFSPPAGRWNSPVPRTAASGRPAVRSSSRVRSTAT